MLVEITSLAYDTMYSSLSQDKQKYISKDVTCLQTIGMEVKGSNELVAVCKIDKSKNRTLWVHGLISTQPGMGKRLLQDVIGTAFEVDEFKYVRLNCIGEPLRKYYESIGFELYLAQESEDIEDLWYYELIHKRK